jgi:hypothetical protein
VFGRFGDDGKIEQLLLQLFQSVVWRLAIGNKLVPLHKGAEAQALARSQAHGFLGGVRRQPARRTTGPLRQSDPILDLIALQGSRQVLTFKAQIALQHQYEQAVLQLAVASKGV